VAYTTITWVSTGYTGAPGYTKLSFIGELNAADASTAAANSRTLLSSISAYIPNIVQYACQPTAQTFGTDTVLTGEVALTTVPVAINGAASGSYVGGSGAVVYWITNVLNGGHKIKGRTYIVPLAALGYQSDGTLASIVVTNLQSAATTFAGSTPNPCIVSRQLGQSDRTNKQALIASASVKDRSAFLRSRRT
jgi:hypothetical protein